MRCVTYSLRGRLPQPLAPLDPSQSSQTRVVQVQPQLETVNNMDAEKQSFARCDYAEELEQAVNEQIKWVFAPVC